jgi:hypothetical protein
LPSNMPWIFYLSKGSLKTTNPYQQTLVKIPHGY